MREVTGYECSDGSVFTDESKARAHETDLLGQELDGLLKMFQFDGGLVTRSMEYRALMAIMKDREKLLTVVRRIVDILEHE